MPVLTCGGMRFQQSWTDLEEDRKVDPKGQDNLETIIHRAFELGVNHFETARGYGTSEHQLGFVLPSLPRDDIIVQTKIGPKDSEDDFLKAFDVSLKNLQLDYVDLLGIHGINTHELLDKTLRGGTLSACRKLQARGLVRHVGFSTHGPLDAILAAVQTDEFSYVNLHWYYFDPLNWPAVVSASERDMGVYIISPSEKGGRLFDPPEKLTHLCSPLTPMGFNDLFCLGHAEVHTLSIGAARPSDFDAHVEVLPLIKEAMIGLGPVMRRLEEAAVQALGADWAATWKHGLPPMVNAPKPIPLYHILRMYTMAKAFDMVEYGKMRYNLLGGGDHWFPGGKIQDLDWDILARELQNYHFADRVPAILREAHAMFNAEDKKRLSKSA
jgi:predicted aldo/keto reductase-like oxidoreductase